MKFSLVTDLIKMKLNIGKSILLCSFICFRTTKRWCMR